MKKPVWVKAVHKQVPEQFCHQFSQKMLSPNLQKSTRVQKECLTLANQALQSCMSQHKKQLPRSFSVGDSDKWGNVLSQCIVDYVYKSQKLPIYMHKDFKQRIFQNRAFVSTRVACQNESMLQYLRGKTKTTRQCVATLTKAQLHCANEALRGQDRYIRGMRKTTGLAKKYMQCLLDKTFKLPQHMRHKIVSS
jgi:hypothetical protein